MGSLAPFAHNWVGGDISGLDALAGECDRPAAQITDAGKALSRQVSSMAGAGSWTGKAADAFTTAWDKDSKAATQLADAWTRIGAIAGRLAADLASLESALEKAAGQLEQQGIQVSAATGIPSPDTVTGGGASPDPRTLVARTQLAEQYMAYRAQILNRAAQARTQATNALYNLTQELLPPQFDYGQLTNDLDGIRGLWAVPTQVRQDFEKALAGKGKVDAAAWDELLAKHKISGYNARLEKSTIEELARTRTAAADAAGRLDGAPPESPLTRLSGGDAEGLGAAGAAATAIKAIPFVGASAGAIIQVVQDRQNHESWRHSLVDGVVSNGASLAAGAAVAGAVTGIVAGVVGGGSFVAVAAGATFGTVAAVGVGDFVHNVIQENWAQDWQQHGVLDGTAHGVADSFDKTRHDLAHFGDDIKNIF